VVSYPLLCSALLTECKYNGNTRLAARRFGLLEFECAEACNFQPFLRLNSIGFAKGARELLDS
jgi:hypothetical protein